MTTSYWEEIAWHRFDDPGSQTEPSIDPGSHPRGPADDDWGRSDSVDPDNVGDIADEGAGHRG